MDERRRVAGLLLAVGLLAGGCSNKAEEPETGSAETAASAATAAPASAAPMPTPIPVPRPVPPEPGSALAHPKGDPHPRDVLPGVTRPGSAAIPVSAVPGAEVAPAPGRYPHVEAIFYAETPERVGEVAKACLEVLPPGVSASTVDPAAYQCKAEEAGAAMGTAQPVAREDGTPGVDSAEYMKAVLGFDSEDFEVPTRELLLHFSRPGQHKSFEFRIIPKRIGERQLTVQLFTTDKDGAAIEDIFDGKSTVQVHVGSDPVTNLGWLFEHWEGLTAAGGALLTLWLTLTRGPRAWLRRRLGLPPADAPAPGREPGAGES